jgi:ATP phosphoribosyltransferase
LDHSSGFFVSLYFEWSGILKKKKMLRIAVQKSGRLQEDSLLILKECGLKVDASNGKLKSIVPNFPLEVLFLRNSDIPQYVEDGVVDIAIIGENLLIEEESKLEVLLPLSFSKCRVSLAVPKNSDIQSVKDFEGKKIATSYPATVQNYLRKNGVTAEIHTISGSVEVAPTIGLADGICDIVSSGNTLFMNGLRELEVILQSEAVLVQNSKLSIEKKDILDKLIFRMKAVLSSRNSKYILLNAPNEAIAEISRILPGMKSPTVLPLAEPGWSSLHSVISEDQFWEKIDALKNAGAEGILIVPIEKMVL